MPVKTRPLHLGPLRAFLAVAEHLNFRLAAEQLSLTQSAVSRQIQTLEEEVGVALFIRHTRSVELSPQGGQLLQALRPLVSKLDSSVRQLRTRSARKSVAITTWASFASMWLIPRMEAFQKDNPEIDIRIDTSDSYLDLEEAGIDLALRYGLRKGMPTSAQRLFGEELTPVVSPGFFAKNPGLKKPSDLARHTLLEEISANSEELTWRSWLARQGAEPIEPKRWLHMGYSYQLVQAALSGQGVALARTPLVADQLADGQLREPIKGGRVASSLSYWLVANPQTQQRPEVTALAQWICLQAAVTRKVLGEP